MNNFRAIAARLIMFKQTKRIERFSKPEKLLFKILIFSFIIISHQISSQTVNPDVYDLNLNELTKLKITTASKVTQDIKEVASTVYIISSAEIRENGYFTLEEALSDLPGFQFRNIQGINSYVFQRGVPNQNNKILVLIDGVETNELNSGGFYGGGQYNLSDVERIEVICGPASVVYGTNAISGVINIITFGAKKKHVSLNALGGNFKTSEEDITFSNVNQKQTVGVMVSGMIKKTGKGNLKGAAGDNNWTDDMDNFEDDYSFDVKLQIKDFQIGTNYQLKESSTATWQKSTGTNYKDYGTSWNIQFINNYIKYHKNFSDKLSLSSVLYNRNSTVLSNTVYYVLDTAQVGAYRPNNLTGIENIINYNVTDKLSITSGLTLEYEQLAEDFSYTYSNSMTSKPERPSKPAMTKDYLGSIFVEPRLKLLNNLYLSGGVRFDASSVYNQVLTPRAGIIYHRKKHLLRFSYSEAYRAPKPWDYTNGIGNSSLVPEKMKSFELGYTYTILENLNIFITGYKNLLENAINQELVNNIFMRTINSGEIKTNGAEIYLRYNRQRIKTSINYTYNESYDQSGLFVPEISKHSGNASITYSFTEFIKLNLRANYTGKRENTKLIVSTDSKYVEPSIVFHGALSLLNYKGYTVQIIVKNILNKEYYHTSNRMPDRYRQSQRTILLNLGYAI